MRNMAHTSLCELLSCNNAIRLENVVALKSGCLDTLRMMCMVNRRCCRPHTIHCSCLSLGYNDVVAGYYFALEIGWMFDMACVILT